MKALVKHIMPLSESCDNAGFDKTPDMTVMLTVVVRPDERCDEDVEEHFTVSVIHIDELARVIKERGPVFGYWSIFYDDFDYQHICNTIRFYIESCEADTWDEFALKVAKIGQWEFEIDQYAPVYKE